MDEGSFVCFESNALLEMVLCNAVSDQLALHPLATPLSFLSSPAEHHAYITCAPERHETVTNHGIHRLVQQSHRLVCLCRLVQQSYVMMGTVLYCQRCCPFLRCPCLCR
jgi:hypothetical protein